MIFCVEDDAAIRDLMVYTLESSGMEARGFNDGRALFDELEKDGADLPQMIMLDIMLPGDDGMALLKKLKDNPRFADIPVIMETAKGTEFDKVNGLDSGADDYLAKPFGMMEMVARVKAVLRRVKPEEQRSMQLVSGAIEMSPEEHRAMVSGEELQLTLKEFEILEMLIRNPGTVFTREQLLSYIWGVDFKGETRTVDVHIGTLRTKLGESGSRIKTVHGLGYRLEAE